MAEELTESIYNLIKKEEVPVPKGPAYKSRFAEACKTQAAVAPKRDGALFGPPGAARPDPKKFLTKGSGATGTRSAGSTKSKTSSLGPVSPGRRSAGVSRTKAKPDIPRDRGEIAERSDKDFLHSNGKEVWRTPKKFKEEEEENFLEKPDFGKVPRYLAKVQSELAREAEEAAPPPPLSPRSAAAPPGTRPLQQEERDALIAALKAKWESVNATYARLPMSVDTNGARTRKDHFETQLTGIEREIEKLLKPNVYVPLDFDINASS